MENVQIKENERIDDLQIKDYRIIQKTDGFCFGIDAVLLSDYARVKKKSKGIDLCSGTGIIPILMEGKYPLAHVEGLEYQEEFAKMAERSVKMNGQEEKVHIVQGDVRNIKTDKMAVENRRPFLYGAQTFSLSGDYLYIKTA